MQIVIDIPEEVYKSIQDNDYCGISNADMYNAVKNGTPLPKGHGKLVDLDQMCHDYWDGGYMEIHSDDLDNIKTIIEADKESEEQA